MDGQAEAPESHSFDDLANFLEENPSADSDEELDAEVSTEKPDAEAKPQLEEEESEEDEEESQEESKPKAKEEAEKPATEEEIEVTIKGDDGSDTKLKVTKDELIKGYQRQSDYTRKTQGLVARETEAVQVFQQKHGELRDDYLKRAEFATQAIARLAEFRSDAEMNQLAYENPAMWAQETQRQTQIRALLGSLEQQTQAERQQAEQQAREFQESQMRTIKERSWAELQKDGMDKPKLQKTYESVMKNYGYEPKDFTTVTDYRLVRMMADAVAYRELKSKAPAVTQQAKAAPKVTQKQTTQATQAKTVRDARFKTGRASLHDLASLL